MRVLNYAPGPLDTDMFEEICQMAADVKLKEAFNKMKQEVCMNRSYLACYRLMGNLRMPAFAVLLPFSNNNDENNSNIL